MKMPQSASPNKSLLHRKGKTNGQVWHTEDNTSITNLPPLSISNYKTHNFNGDTNNSHLLQQQQQQQQKQNRQRRQQQLQLQLQNNEVTNGGSGFFPQIMDTSRSGVLNGFLESNRREENRKKPLSPEDALATYYSRLTSYERTEILSHPEIWFIGTQDVRKIQAYEGSSNNNGYDDDHGSYRKVRGDHILYRYELHETLGRGSFGQVIRAYDHKNKEFVALKIIRNKKRFLHQAGVEVKILEDLRKRNKDGRYHVIHMLDAFRFRNHQCIVFELMGPNLYEVLKRNRFQGFSLSTIRHYTMSILKCLRLLQRLRIIHCDLKPENILVKQNNQSAIKVIDFGSGCYEENRVYTYIQSRFYRSPEVILGLPYTTAIDMWSLACILVELYTGYPLFPGENEEEQMACIMEVIGLPPSELLREAGRTKVFFDSNGDPTTLTNSRGRKRYPGSRDIRQATKSSDPLFVDFISKCLIWLPDKRMTPREALRHEWITERRIRTSNLGSSNRRAFVSSHETSASKSTSSETAAIEISVEGVREIETLEDVVEIAVEHDDDVENEEAENLPDLNENDRYNAENETNLPEINISKRS